MSTLTVTVAGTAIDYGEVELTRGTSDALPAPEAEIQGAVGEFTAGDSVTIATDTETLFTGQVARPRIRRGGRRDLTCEHDLAALFEQEVSVSGTTSVAGALSEAVTNAFTNATLQFDGADVTLSEPYTADGRSVRRIFADLTERTGRIWRVVEPDTIVVEPLGANGSISVDTSTADAAVQQFDPGDSRTVVNDVTVNGTGEERVIGTAADGASINQYGVRSKTTNVNYITTQSEAGDYAGALLRPDPLASASVVVGARSLDVVSQQANATLTLTDPSRGISGVELVIEEQTNTSGGSAVLKAGEGAASSLVTENRQNRSRDDTTEPGSVYGSDRIADGSIDTQKLVNLSITETKITDNSISTPKLQTEAVTANEILTNTITAAQIDTLNLETDELSIGAGLTRQIVFDDLTISGGGETVAVMVPSADNDCLVGFPGTRFAEAHFREVNASNYVTQTPEQLEGVDLDTLAGHSWRNPPAAVAQREDADGEYVRSNPKKNGVELGHMTNYLLEVCKAQQERVEDLESRLAALEDDTDPNA